MLITKIKEAIKGFLVQKGRKMGLPEIRHIYYYVPPCPLCGSMHTGRYVRKAFIDETYMDRKSLENGEIIRQVPREPIKNCFCEDCGYEWGAHIETKFLTADEVNEQRMLRGTYQTFQEYKAENYVNGRPPKPSAFNRWFL